ncbi:MAG: hypothetical protein QOJ99_3658 [Bryobacterales bacterium]|nr:hypothetical protein [Bryobacterales bacterium]
MATTNDPLPASPKVSNPSFLAVHPGKRFLYCVNENNIGTVSAFSISPSNGLLSPLNSVSSGGANPAHLSVYRPVGSKTYYVLVANYSGSTIEAIPILSDGSLGTPSDVVTHTDSLGPNKGRQEAPHPHMILADPSGKYIFVNDLGQDRTYIYTLSPDDGNPLRPAGKFAPGPTAHVQAQPGSGPRHFVFHPNGRWFYSLNELLSTVDYYGWNSNTGTLSHRQNISVLPPDFAGISTTAEIKLSPEANVLYASNRGFDSVAALLVNPRNGTLTTFEKSWTWVRGETPRFFTPDPEGDFLYACNQNTDNITIFDIDDNASKPRFTGRFVGAGNPVCMVFV